MRDIKCIVFGLTILAIFGFFISPADAAPHRAQIAAVVNDEIITTSDIETRILLNTGGRPLARADRQAATTAVLDELINESIQRQEADSLNIAASAAIIAFEAARQRLAR